MMQGKSRRVRRSAAIALVAGLILAIAFAIGYPLEILRRQEAEKASLESRIEGLRAELADRASLSEERRRLEAFQSESRDWIEAASPIVAGAILQGTLDELIEASGGVLEATSLEPPEAMSSATQIAVQIEITSNIEGLRDLLHAIESHKPRLVIRAIAIKRIGGRDGDDRLDVSMEVAALTTAPLPTASAGEGTPEPS